MPMSGSADDGADGTRGLGGDRDAAAPTGMPIIPEPIDDDEIAGPQQAERMVQERRVRAGDGDGNRDADDPLAPEEGPDAPIHETEMRSEERRVGKECVSTGRSRGVAVHL